MPQNLQIFPSVTGFVLRALAAAEIKPVYQHAALLYLKDTQNKAGHWGTAWQYYDTPYYAMGPALEALQLYKEDDGFYNTVIQKAREYLFSSQGPDGSFIYGPAESANRPSAELQIVLALKALLSCNVGYDHVRFQKGIGWLLAKQRKDGSWDGGMFPLPNRLYKKKEDIFCTSQPLIFLYKYINAGNQKWR